MADLLHSLARYDAWANARLMASIDSLPAVPTHESHPQLMRVLAHVAAAKNVWVKRIAGETPGPVWPQWPVGEIRNMLQTADAALLKQAAAYQPRVVEYTNTRGEPFATPLDAIILHVVNHGTYHRGQLASLVKQAGGTPAVTDLIIWQRDTQSPQA